MFLVPGDENPPPADITPTVAEPNTLILFVAGLLILMLYHFRTRSSRSPRSATGPSVHESHKPV